jgi:hypothetical protein
MGGGVSALLVSVWKDKDYKAALSKMSTITMRFFRNFKRPPKSAEAFDIKNSRYVHLELTNPNLFPLRLAHR